MRIDAGMDTGEILLQEEMEIGATETAPELALPMSELGAPLMAQTLRGLGEGSITPRPQNHELASLAPILKKEDGRIDWSRSATEIFHRIRGFAPWPGAYTAFRGQTCHIWGEPASKELAGQNREAGKNLIPGTLRAEGNELLVSCGGATYLRVRSVKLEGRKQVSAAEFLHGARLLQDERFGQP
jgi:methionyl-tRNA formyltransferase